VSDEQGARQGHDELFFSGTPASEREFRDLVGQVVDLILKAAREPARPLPVSAAALRNGVLADTELFPEQGVGMHDAWTGLGARVIEASVNVSSPTYLAHFLAPPLIQSAVAELAVGALNQSLDSFDQGPSATVLESAIIGLCCEEVGFTGGNGVFTAGATMSNLMGLLLGREYAVAHGARPVVVTSALAHHSIRLAGEILGLPADRVLSVPVTVAGSMDGRALEREVRSIADSGGFPIIAMTVGTTDTGAADPVDVACDLAESVPCWVHADAAATGALALSRRHRSVLGDLSKCDSLALDFHKLGWQSVSSGCFLVRNSDTLELIRHHADYLNPVTEPDDDNLVWKSVQTTRRFDALKLAMCLQGLGRDGYDSLISAQQDAVAYAAERIAGEPDLEIVVSGGFYTLLFRFVGDRSMGTERVNRLNESLRQELLSDGRVLGRSRHGGTVSLKLQILNPRVTRSDVDALVDAVLARGHKLTEAEIQKGGLP
jgi:L-2,4-diaminobutyrate decarboxylase